MLINRIIGAFTFRKGVYAEVEKHVEALEVKGTCEKVDSGLVTGGFQGLEISGSEFEFLKHFPLRARPADVSLLVGGQRRAARGEGVASECLKLHSVGAAVGGHFHHGLGQGPLSVVVDPRLGDYIDGQPGTYPPFTHSYGLSLRRHFSPIR